MVRNVFMISLSDHQVLHDIASSSNFFDFARISSLFRSYRGFARQPCCMAGTMKMFCITKNICSHRKKNLLFLPCKKPLFRTSKLLEFNEFLNKTIIPIALIGNETGYSLLGATRLVGYLPSDIQRALKE